MKEMTSLQRCMAVLNGEVPDMLPVIPQSFMYAVETAGLKISDVNKDGRKMAQAHILSQEKYGYDGCVIDFDDASIAEAIGAKVIFREDEPATVDEEQPVLKDLRIFMSYLCRIRRNRDVYVNGWKLPVLWSMLSAIMFLLWDVPTRDLSVLLAC